MTINHSFITISIKKEIGTYNTYVKTSVRFVLRFIQKKMICNFFYCLAFFSVYHEGEMINHGMSKDGR